MQEILRKLKSLTRDQKERILDTVFDRYFAVPFGSFAKRDLDTLLLFAIMEAGVMDTCTNREMSNLLGINETRLKGYLLDVRYKYKEDHSEQNVRDFIKRLLASGQPRLSHENGWFTFVIEDPVLRSDIDSEMKRLSYFSDTSFNREVIKIRDYMLIGFLFHHYDNTFKDFKKLLRANAKDKEDLLKVISSSRPWPEKAKELMGIVEKAGGLASTLAGIGPLFSGVP